jgi:hypothetical protein
MFWCWSTPDLNLQIIEVVCFVSLPTCSLFEDVTSQTGMGSCP